jgi:hypothetical protein
MTRPERVEDYIEDIADTIERAMRSIKNLKMKSPAAAARCRVHHGVRRKHQSRGQFQETIRHPTVS